MSVIYLIVSLWVIHTDIIAQFKNPIMYVVLCNIHRG